MGWFSKLWFGVDKQSGTSEAKSHVVECFEIEKTVYADKSENFTVILYKNDGEFSVVVPLQVFKKIEDARNYVNARTVVSKETVK